MAETVLTEPASEACHRYTYNVTCTAGASDSVQLDASAGESPCKQPSCLQDILSASCIIQMEQFCRDVFAGEYPDTTPAKNPLCNLFSRDDVDSQLASVEAETEVVLGGPVHVVLRLTGSLGSPVDAVPPGTHLLYTIFKNSQQVGAADREIKNVVWVGSNGLFNASVNVLDPSKDRAPLTMEIRAVVNGTKETNSWPIRFIAGPPVAARSEVYVISADGKLAKTADITTGEATDIVLVLRDQYGNRIVAPTIFDARSAVATNESDTIIADCASGELVHCPDAFFYFVESSTPGSRNYSYSVNGQMLPPVTINWVQRVDLSSAVVSVDGEKNDVTMSAGSSKTVRFQFIANGGSVLSEDASKDTLAALGLSVSGCDASNVEVYFAVQIRAAVGMPASDVFQVVQLPQSSAPTMPLSPEVAGEYLMETRLIVKDVSTDGSCAAVAGDTFISDKNGGAIRFTVELGQFNPASIAPSTFAALTGKPKPETPLPSLAGIANSPLQVTATPADVNGNRVHFSECTNGTLPVAYYFGPASAAVPTSVSASDMTGAGFTAATHACLEDAITAFTAVSDGETTDGATGIEYVTSVRDFSAIAPSAASVLINLDLSSVASGSYKLVGVVMGNVSSNTPITLTSTFNIDASKTTATARAPAASVPATVGLSGATVYSGASVFIDVTLKASTGAVASVASLLADVSASVSVYPAGQPGLAATFGVTSCEAAFVSRQKACRIEVAGTATAAGAGTYQVDVSVNGAAATNTSFTVSQGAASVDATTVVEVVKVIGGNWVRADSNTVAGGSNNVALVVVERDAQSNIRSFAASRDAGIAYTAELASGDFEPVAMASSPLSSLAPAMRTAIANAAGVSKSNITAVLVGSAEVPGSYALTAFMSSAAAGKPATVVPAGSSAPAPLTAKASVFSADLVVGAGSPVASESEVSGDGVSSASAGVEAQFAITLFDGQGSFIAVTADAVNASTSCADGSSCIQLTAAGATLKVFSSANLNLKFVAGLFTDSFGDELLGVTYTPTAVGSYSLNVTLDGALIGPANTVTVSATIPDPARAQLLFGKQGSTGDYELPLANASAIATEEVFDGATLTANKTAAADECVAFAVVLKDKFDNELSETSDQQFVLVDGTPSKTTLPPVSVLLSRVSGSGSRYAGSLCGLARSVWTFKVQVEADFVGPATGFAVTVTSGTFNASTSAIIVRGQPAAGVWVPVIIAARDSVGSFLDADESNVDVTVTSSGPMYQGTSDRTVTVQERESSTADIDIRLDVAGQFTFSAKLFSQAVPIKWLPADVEVPEELLEVPEAVTAFISGLETVDAIFVKPGEPTNMVVVAATNDELKAAATANNMTKFRDVEVHLNAEDRPIVVVIAADEFGNVVPGYELDGTIGVAVYANASLTTPLVVASEVELLVTSSGDACLLQKAFNVLNVTATDCLPIAAYALETGPPGDYFAATVRLNSTDKSVIPGSAVLQRRVAVVGGIVSAPDSSLVFSDPCAPGSSASWQINQACNVSVNARDSNGHAVKFAAPPTTTGVTFDVTATVLDILSQEVSTRTASLQGVSGEVMKIVSQTSRLFEAVSSMNFMLVNGSLSLSVTPALSRPLSLSVSIGEAEIDGSHASLNEVAAAPLNASATVVVADASQTVCTKDLLCQIMLQLKDTTGNAFTPQAGDVAVALTNLKGPASFSSSVAQAQAVVADDGGFVFVEYVYASNSLSSSVSDFIMRVDVTVGGDSVAQVPVAVIDPSTIESDPIDFSNSVVKGTAIVANVPSVSNSSSYAEAVQALVSSGASVAAGASATISVQLRTAAGLVIPSDRGVSVTLTIEPVATATTVGDQTIDVAFDADKKQFTAAYTAPAVAGAYEFRLSANDGSNTTEAGSQLVAVTPGAPALASSVLSVAPNATTDSGVEARLELRDSNGNPMPVSSALAIASSLPSVSVTASVGGTVVSTVAMSLDTRKAAATQNARLVATLATKLAATYSVQLTSGSSPPLQVAVAPGKPSAAKSMACAPGAAIAGEAFPIAVLLRDANGNAVKTAAAPASAKTMAAAVVVSITGRRGGLNATAASGEVMSVVNARTAMSAHYSRVSTWNTLWSNVTKSAVSNTAKTVEAMMAGSTVGSTAVAVQAEDAAVVMMVTPSAASKSQLSVRSAGASVPAVSPRASSLRFAACSSVASAATRLIEVSHGAPSMSASSATLVVQKSSTTVQVVSSASEASIDAGMSMAVRAHMMDAVGNVISSQAMMNRLLATAAHSASSAPGPAGYPRTLSGKTRAAFRVGCQSDLGAPTSLLTRAKVLVSGVSVASYEAVKSALTGATTAASPCALAFDAAQTVATGSALVAAGTYSMEVTCSKCGNATMPGASFKVAFKHAASGASAGAATVKPIQAPSVVSAQFTSTARAVVVRFSTPTNRAGTFGAFKCEQLLHSTTMAKLGSKPVCSFSANGQSLSIRLRSDATLKQNDKIRLVTASASSAWDNTTKVLLSVNENSFEYYDSAGSGTAVALPSNLQKPFAFFTAPPTVASCINFTLNARRSSGVGGRPLKYSWSATVPSSVSSSARASLQSHLSSLPSSSSNPRAIGARFPAGVEVTVTVTVTDAFAQTATYSRKIKVSSLALPLVRVKAPAVNDKGVTSILAGDAMALFADVTLPPCAPDQAITYRWSVPGSVIKVPKEFASGQVLYVPDNTLTPGSTYTMRVDVSYRKYPTVSAYATAVVQVQRSPVSLSIDGSSAAVSRVSSEYEIFTLLDDPDDPDEEGRASYTWTCQKLDASGAVTSGSCSSSVAFQRSLSTATADLTVPANALPADTTYKFSVSVVKQPGSRTASTSMTLGVVSDALPGVEAFAASAEDLIDPSDELALVGFVSSVKPTQCCWSVANGALDMDGSGGDEVCAELTEEESEEFDEFENVVMIKELGEGALAEGTEYEISFSCEVELEDGSEAESEATFSFTTNGAPFGGSLEVHNGEGETVTSVSEGDEVTLVADDWYDNEDGEDLEYVFTVVLTDENGELVDSPIGASHQPELSLIVPAGKTANVVLGVLAFDSLGAFGYAETNITVNKAVRSCSSVVQRLGALLSAGNDAGVSQFLLSLASGSGCNSTASARRRLLNVATTTTSKTLLDTTLQSLNAAGARVAPNQRTALSYLQSVVSAMDVGKTLADKAYMLLSSNSSINSPASGSLTSSVYTDAKVGGLTGLAKASRPWWLQVLTTITSATVSTQASAGAAVVDAKILSAMSTLLVTMEEALAAFEATPAATLRPYTGLSTNAQVTARVTALRTVFNVARRVVSQLLGSSVTCGSPPPKATATRTSSLAKPSSASNSTSSALSILGYRVCKQQGGKFTVTGNGKNLQVSLPSALVTSADKSYFEMSFASKASYDTAGLTNGKYASGVLTVSLIGKQVHGLSAPITMQMPVDVTGDALKQALLRAHYRNETHADTWRTDGVTVSGSVTNGVVTVSTTHLTEFALSTVSTSCSSHSTCSACSADSQCGWCVGSGQCVAGTSAGPTDSSACPALTSAQRTAYNTSSAYLHTGCTCGLGSSSTSMCSGQGSCSNNLQASASCSCASTHVGSTCSLACPVNGTQVCNNQGSCSESGGAAVCTCNSGWSGTACTTQTSGGGGSGSGSGGTGSGSNSTGQPIDDDSDAALGIVLGVLAVVAVGFAAAFGVIYMRKKKQVEERSKEQPDGFEMAPNPMHSTPQSAPPALDGKKGSV